MQHEMELLGHGADALQGAAQECSTILQHARAPQSGTLKSRLMSTGHDPGFVWNARRIGTHGDVVATSFEVTLGLALFLREDVTKNAALFLIKIIASCTELIKLSPRHKRRSRKLPVRMLECLSDIGAVVLQNTDLSKASLAVG